MKKILVLGATGSIGTSTLEIARNMPDEFQICGLQAHSNEDKLKLLAKEFNCPSLLSKNDNSKEAFLKLIEQAKPDIVVNGIAGSAGLIPSKTVLECKIDLALANKETIVMAGPLIKDLSKKYNTPIIPVDSEHSAIFNLVEKIGKENLSSVVITASGGPFREYTKEQLQNVTLEQALNHPTWKMGPKITVDSSTLANKGLEVIEAAYLFDVKPSEIEVVVHPQSLIHSLVRTKDGMLYAQISDPDMKHPIFGALTWPRNQTTYLKPFNLFDHPMTFYRPRMDDFPLLAYAFECSSKGLAYTIAFNAANEIAVWAFLDKKLKYSQIQEVVYKTLQEDFSEKITDFNQILEVDTKARNYAKNYLK